jgi:aminopeptidase YwaD
MRLLLVLAVAVTTSAQTIPFLSEREIAALASEISGESAKRNLEGLSRHHRMRGSRGFRAASEQIVAELKRYGYADAHIESLPADGTIFYGTQRSRPAWNAERAELWELDGSGAHVHRIASWESAPIVLAQDSVSGDVTAELIDVGAGTADADYANKDVRGKLVLASSQPGPVAAKALPLGAVGIISYAQNQRTAWYGEDETLIRWGHLDTFAAQKTFAFMVSLKTARNFQMRLAGREKIRLHATVIAGQEKGAYDIATATIPGSEKGEIVFSCHLDHPRPGANDNASGCATILEVARTLSKLMSEERLPKPRKTIRFVWPAEIEGTLALLNGKPEIAKNIRAAIHLDMVGGGPETKAIFHVTRGPASAPSFIYDVADAVGTFVNEQSEAYAKTGTAKYPLIASDGSKDPLRAALATFSEGSDHQVYTDSSFGIPSIYLNDWPDRYIHTNRDVPANIDSTKLARAAFIAAASGYVLARLTPDDTPAIQAMMEPFALERRARAMRRRTAAFHEWYERGMNDSVARFFSGPVPVKRNVRGPMSAFGYDYFDAHYKGAPVRLAPSLRYEALNLWDGTRSDATIRDLLAAISGESVKVEDVTQYLDALASIDVIPRAGSAPSK